MEALTPYYAEQVNFEDTCKGFLEVGKVSLGCHCRRCLKILYGPRFEASWRVLVCLSGFGTLDTDWPT
ncbi:hypothetical protein M758_1G304300 [Ceratodon purpureus]|nr:hypothetical protein M758_1G304300 [Ceratodon purpureus]